MRITHVRLRRFRKFPDWQTSFPLGLTVIRGGNEAGKTTIMEAIFEGLFGNPSREGLERLRPWGEQRLGEVSMEIQAGGGRYLLRKDLEAGTILLQSEGGHDRLATFREVQKRLLEWIGLASEVAYRATAFVGQADLARVTEDRRLLSTHLSRILSGAGVETVQQALHWLGERRQRLAAELGGPKGVTERISELRAQQVSQRQREERALRHRVDLRTVLHRQEELEREAADKAEQARLASRAAELQQREQALIKDEAATREHLERTKALLARLDELHAGLSEFSAQQEERVADLFAARRHYLVVQSGLAGARGQLEKEERILEHLATHHQSARRAGGVGWTLTAAGLICVAGGAGVMVAVQSAAGWVPIGVGVALVAAGLWYRGRTGDAGGDYRAQEQRVLDLRRSVDVAQGQLAEAETDVAARLRIMGSASLEEVEQRFSSYMDLLREREEIRAALRQVHGEDPRATLEERLRRIAADLASVRETLASIPNAASKGQSISAEQVEQDSRAVTAELRALLEKRARLEGMLEELRDRADDGARLEEEIAALESRAASHREMIDVLDLTAKKLEDARALSVYPARGLLERGAGAYLGAATAGAYTRVALDERTLRPQVWVPAANTWKDPSDLSQATCDQLYLCLRLALLDVIAGDHKPPLLLDEPFAHLDDERRRAMTALLREAARHRQVVLFTCWPDFDAVAERVVVLDRVAVA